MWRRMLVNMLRSVFVEAMGTYIETLDPDRKEAAKDLMGGFRAYLQVRRKYRWLSRLIPETW